MPWRFCLRCAALLTGLAFGARAGAQSTAVVFPSDDTWVRQGGHSSQPRGRKKQMVIAATRFGLVKFNLISLMPASTQIKRATLEMVPIKMPPKATIWLLAMGGEWSEAGATDVNAPPIIMVPVGEMDVPTRSNRQSLDADVTDIVRRWVANPSENNGLALKTEEGESVVFATKENVPRTPRLIVAFEESSGGECTTCPLGSTGPTGTPGPMGPTGVTGTTGASGPTGPTGAGAATGPQGPTGSQGIQGIGGPSGATGASGSTGHTGSLRGTG